MPKKQKIDKQLNKLFKDFRPEETATDEKRRPKVEKEAPALAPLTPVPVVPQQIVPSRPIKRHTATLIPPEPFITPQFSTSSTPSNYSVNFQSGIRDWATLRVMDESDQRIWTPDEQLLIKQVIDQLSLAMENARLFQETQQALDVTHYRAEAQSVINDIAADFLNLTDSAGINQAINKSLGRIGQFMKIDRAYIFLFNQDGTTMDNTHEWRASGVESYIDDFRNIPRNSLPYMMSFFDHMEPFVISNVADLPDEASVDRNEYQRERIKSIMCVPITLQNEAVGFVGLDAVTNQRTWGDEDVATLRLYGQIGISALERGRNQEAISRRNEYLAVSAEIGKLVTSTLDLNSIFTRTVKLISERFGFYHAAIFIVEETGFNAILREATGEAGAMMRIQGHSLPVNPNSVVGKVTSDGQAVVVNDVLIDSLHKVNPLLPDTRAEAAIPLRIGNRVIGAVDIQSTTANAFTEDEISVLQTLADQVAIAIDNARSYELSQEAVKEMRETDRVKSQFLANMSHELRTPLNSIIGFSRVILKGIDGPVTELQQQDLTAIYNSGQHLLGLINDILDLARIEAGKMELNFEEVKLSEMVNSVLSTAKGLVKEKPIQLVSKIPADMPTVRGDTMRVRQVLINLLSNASKFTDEGTITVEALVHKGPNGKPEALINVIDTGPGISQEGQEKLFKAFSQVDGSATRKSGGSGLGLSICANLVQLHGGRISVHSSEGKGSTFWFTLPLFNQPEEIIPEDKKIILAIDDDPQVISLYERYLNPQGYHVVPLTDPAKAKEKILEIKPYAVTLDIMMPNVDGWTVLTTLKSDPETRHYPVVICSIMEQSDKGFNLGASDYLVKPILEEDIVNAISKLNRDGNIREIMVIDDDPNDLRLMEKILKEHGQYKPIIMEGGRKGWEAMNTLPPDAIILDIFMPEMDGFTILEKMHENPILREIPVLVVSGGGLTNEQHEQLAEYGKRLITKGSLKENELIASIESALKQIG